MKLYKFRAVPLPIIRSLFTVHSALVYAIQVSSRTRMELRSILVLLESAFSKLYDIYQCRVYSE